MSDICVELSGTLLNFRVGGIILSDEQILLCRLTEESWWYPPGGRIRTGESSLAAIHRELEEELEGEWEVTSLKATAENFFDYRGQLCQECCVFYEVRWLSARNKLISKSHEVFCWFPLEALAKLDIKPAFLQTCLPSQISPPAISYITTRTQIIPETKR